ncbi:hypothetical protein ACFQE1_15175 [Halobium palmae]|uniref:Uncharacterized protein n=1 Tax=Halobium palmae TaxID=1776492 RepID=A0ABD5S1W6_9EURY
MFDDAISGLPDVFCADVSLPNPSSLVSRATAMDATDLIGSHDADADRTSTPLCSDGGYDPDRDAARERDRVYDAGLVVRLEADGVLFHEGDGRTTGRWIAADRAAVVSLGEVD